MPINIASPSQVAENIVGLLIIFAFVFVIIMKTKYNFEFKDYISGLFSFKKAFGKK